MDDTPCVRVALTSSDWWYRRQLSLRNAEYMHGGDANLRLVETGIRRRQLSLNNAEYVKEGGHFSLRLQWCYRR